MSLGFTPVIIAATGGPTNPVGITVTAIAGALYVISKFLPIGAGRKEADYLTDPRTGSQAHAGEALAQVIDYHDAHPELWTPGEIDQVIGAIEKIRDDFVTYAGQFSRAGPGAIQTIRSVTDRLIADRKRERDALEERNGVPMPPTTIGPVRLFLVSSEPYDRIDTGVVGGPLDSKQFQDMQAFYDYARSRHELILEVHDAETAADYLSGAVQLPFNKAIMPPETAASGLPWWAWAGLAYGAKILLFG